MIEDAAIAAARAAGEGVVLRTPVLPSTTLSRRCGGTVLLGAENLQRTGSFKVRGALAKIAAIGDVAANGVVAASAGNHAQGLALAAQARGVRCEVYVPAGAPIAKVEAARGYGATVVVAGPSVEDAVTAARARAEDAGMVFVHPFDDEAVIAGAATLGLELVENVPDLGSVVVPLGGGGLLAGLGTAVKRLKPGVRIIGVQATACAPYATGAEVTGEVFTLADGIAVHRPGAITGPIVRDLADDIVTVDEDAIADAMVLLLERAKLVVEGAGAAGVAALLAGAVRPSTDTVTAVVLSGGNVDANLIGGLVRRHEARAGRRVILFARLRDRPGELARLLAVIAEHGANVLEVEHEREGLDLHPRETGVRVVLEVRDRQHATAVVEGARAVEHDVRWDRETP